VAIINGKSLSSGEIRVKTRYKCIVAFPMGIIQGKIQANQVLIEIKYE